MNAHPRFLLHSIDAATYAAGNRSRRRSDIPGAIAFLAVTMAICAVLLWADRAFV